MTAALEPEPNHTISHAEQLDIAPMGAEIRAYRVEGLHHARLEIQRMQPIQQEQGANQVVTRKAVDHCRTCRPRICDDVHHPLQDSAVQIHERPDQRLDAGPHGRVGDRLDVADQRLDPPDVVPEGMVFTRRHDNLQQNSGDRSQKPEDTWFSLLLIVYIAGAEYSDP